MGTEEREKFEKLPLTFVKSEKQNNWAFQKVVTDWRLYPWHIIIKHFLPNATLILLWSPCVGIWPGLSVRGNQQFREGGIREGRGGTVAVRSVGCWSFGGRQQKSYDPPQPIDHNFCFFLLSPRAETVENWGGGGWLWQKGERMRQIKALSKIGENKVRTSNFEGNYVARNQMDGWLFDRKAQ